MAGSSQPQLPPLVATNRSFPSVSLSSNFQGGVLWVWLLIPPTNYGPSTDLEMGPLFSGQCSCCGESEKQGQVAHHLLGRIRGQGSLL